MAGAIKFEDYKQRITDAINRQLRLGNPKEKGGFTLVDGFIMSPIHGAIDGNITLGGSTLPVVAVVGNTTGLVYYYSIKVLIPEIDLS